MPNSKNFDFPEFTLEPMGKSTRRMALEELPRQAQIDRDMAIIRAHHERIE
jgi:hypothetical protein